AFPHAAMQNATSASQAPPAPASPAPPAAAASPAPQAVVQLDGVPLLPGVPRNPNEVQAMRARRSELSNQLNSAESRRDDLVGELSEVPASVQAGMQQRIELLDERILRIEGEIAETGRLLAASPAIALREPRNQD